MSTALTNADTTLTDKQLAFCDALLDEDISGNIRLAKLKAGYSPNTVLQLTPAMKERMKENAETYLAMNSFKAAYKMVGVLDNPTELGNDKLLEASKQILDRVGITKKEMLEVTNNSPNAILILPAKQKEE